MVLEQWTKTHKYMYDIEIIETHSNRYIYMKIVKKAKKKIKKILFI